MVGEIVGNVGREVGVDTGQVCLVRIVEDRLEVRIVLSEGRQEDLWAEVRVVRQVGIVPLGRPHSVPVGRQPLSRPQRSVLRRSEPVLLLHLRSLARPGLRLLDAALDWLGALETLEVVREGERRDALLEAGSWLGLGLTRPTLERIEVNLGSRESLGERLAGEQEEVGHHGSALSVLESLKRQRGQRLVLRGRETAGLEAFVVKIVGGQGGGTGSRLVNDELRLDIIEDTLHVVVQVGRGFLSVIFPVNIVRAPGGRRCGCREESFWRCGDLASVNCC